MNTAEPIHPLSKAILILLCVLLVLAPIFRAGNTPLAGILLQWLGLVILITSLWRPRDVALTRTETGLILLLLAIPLLYLIPLPSGLVDALPGRGLILAGQAILAPEGGPTWKTLSIDPALTVAAGLVLIVPVAVFIGTRLLDAKSLLILAQLLIVIAVVQAIIGLIQFGTGQTGETLLEVAGSGGRSGTGTYANRNHLAGLLAMTLPLTLALLLYSLGRKRTAGGGGTWRRRAAFLGSGQGNLALLYGAAALIILIGLVFTRSRTGIAMGMLSLVLITLLFARRIGGSNTFGITGTIIVAAIGFGIAIGLAPVLDRFSVTGVVEDGRHALFASTLTGIATFFPIGSGPGTFPIAFTPLQPLEFGRQFVNRAHNDYLEWTMDVGVLALAVILLAFILYLRQWTRVYTRHEWSQSRFLQVSAGVGLLLIALHEIVDYNLAIPANQAFFALLAGIFFMPPERLEPNGGRRRRQRRTPHLDSATGAAVMPEMARVSVAPQPPPDQITNPFAEVVSPAPTPAPTAVSPAPAPAPAPDPQPAPSAPGVGRTEHRSNS